MENLIVTQHLPKTKCSGKQLEMTGQTVHGACVQCISHTTSFPHVLRVFHWERPALWVPNPAKTHKQVCASMRTIGTSAHRRIDTSAAPKFVSFLRSFSSSLGTVFIHVQHLPCLSDVCFLSAVSGARLKQKRRRAGPMVSESEEVGADYCPWRSIPIPLTHTLAVNSNPCSKKHWESKHHTAPPLVTSPWHR